jgi:pilus assembly protein CpaB
VDSISGVSGLLTPGDRVDLLGTFPVSSKEELIPDASGGGSVGYVTMTLLQNVTLLAVGQQLSSVSAQQDGRRNNYSTVTLSVTVDEAELLTIAQTRGKLMLLLRNREDIKTVAVTKRTLKEVLQELEVIQEKRNTIVKKKVRKAPVKTEPSIDFGAGNRP